MNSSDNPVDELERAFEACLSIPTDTPKSSAELNINRFIETARKLEVFFLQKQLVLSDNQDITDELAKLKQRIAGREATLSKYAQKLEYWKKSLQ